MIYFFIALRSAWANLRKNAFPIVTIGAGLCGLFVFLGYIQNTMENFREFTIQNGLGHLTVAKDEAYFRYGELTPFEFILDDKLIEPIRSASHAYAVIPSLGFSGLVSYGEKTVNAEWRGFEPSSIVFPTRLGSTVPRGPFWLGRLASGTNLSPGAEKQVVLGQGVLDILGVPLGAKVTLVALLADGSVNAADFTVVGSFVSPGRDKVLGVVRLADAQDLLGVAGPSSISVLLDSTAFTDQALSQVRQTVAARPGWVVKTWSDQAEYYRQVNTMFLSFFVIIASLILVITLFSTVNTLNMSVWARLRELGTMRVLGTPESRIVWILFLEGVAVGAMGVSFGYIASVVVSAVIDALGGLPIVFQSQVLMMKTATKLDSLPLLLLVFSLVAGLASIIPGVQAIRRNPAENLREL